MFKFLKPFESKIPGLAWFNTAYSLAPTSKWGLSIVPLYGVFTGTPHPSKIDEQTSASLACTGFVWTFYAMIITPQNAGSMMLAAVNLAMGSVNGYNVYRKRQWMSQQQQQQQQQQSK
jgi:mitochondrial pyruvate carrier 2